MSDSHHFAVPAIPRHLAVERRRDSLLGPRSSSNGGSGGGYHSARSPYPPSSSYNGARIPWSPQTPRTPQPQRHYDAHYSSDDYPWAAGGYGTPSGSSRRREDLLNLTNTPEVRISELPLMLKSCSHRSSLYLSPTAPAPSLGRHAKATLRVDLFLDRANGPLVLDCLQAQRASQSSFVGATVATQPQCPVNGGVESSGGVTATLWRRTIDKGGRQMAPDRLARRAELDARECQAFATSRKEERAELQQWLAAARDGFG